MLPDPLIGQVIAGSYSIERHVADGGMGRVYCGRHLRLGHQVAIKVLSAEHSASSESRQRFEREARIAAQLSHPHIVKVYDFDALPDGNYFLAMEWLEGQNIHDLLRRGLEASQIPELLRQLAAAIDFAHAKGVVHRDLKPDNVFVISGGENKYFVKVLDFGIAKVPQHTHGLATQTGVIMGTPAYMAPEQAEGSRDIGAAADRYAFAAMAMEMITGGLPHALDTPARTLVSLLTQEPRLPGHYAIPYQRLDRVFRRALARDPAARFATCSEFVRELIPLLDTTAFDAYAPTIRQPLNFPANPSRRSFWTMVTVTTIVAVAAGAGYFINRSANTSAKPNTHTKTTVAPPPSDPVPVDASVQSQHPSSVQATSTPRTSPRRSKTQAKKAPASHDGVQLPMPDEVFAP